MSRVVYVLGAGVDVPLGLPTAAALLGEVATFAKGDGRPIERALRGKLGRLMFNFTRFTGEQGETFGERLLSTHAHVIDGLRSALGKHPDQQSATVNAMRKVIDNLDDIRRKNQLDEDTVGALAILAGESADVSGGDTLLNPRGLALTHIPRMALRRTFQGLPDVISLTDQEREALEEMVAIIANFEELLADLFSGFYTNNPAEQKKYLYVAWLLWAYLKVRMEQARQSQPPSFYDHLASLPEDHAVITFNYTDFFDASVHPRVKYFHGDCSSYVRFDNREVIRGDERVAGVIDVDSARAFIEGLDADAMARRLYLPGIIPPLRIKPVICREYLETWAECGPILDQADVIVIVGYSFNVFDDHFNDLLRKSHHDTPIVVLNRSLDGVVQNVIRVLRTNPDDLNNVQIGGLSCQKGGRLTFVPVSSDKVDPALLQQVTEQTGSRRGSARRAPTRPRWQH